MCAAVGAAVAATAAARAANVRVQRDALHWRRGHRVHQHLRRPARADAAPAALPTHAACSLITAAPAGSSGWVLSPSSSAPPSAAVPAACATSAGNPTSAKLATGSASAATAAARSTVAAAATLAACAAGWLRSAASSAGSAG